MWLKHGSADLRFCRMLMLVRRKGLKMQLKLSAVVRETNETNLADFRGQWKISSFTLGSTV